MSLRGVIREKLDKNPIDIGKQFIEECKKNKK